MADEREKEQKKHQKEYLERVEKEKKKRRGLVILNQNSFLCSKRRILKEGAKTWSVY